MTKSIKTADEVATFRFNLIAPLVGADLDKGLRHDLMHGIAEKSGLSERTLRRYLAAWQEGGFEALKPQSGWERPDRKVFPEFDQIVAAAIELRRESPSRSVADIIKIMELEGIAEPGTIARSTLQRHLASQGYASSQMCMYTNHQGTAARRFQKTHRGQLWQSDIKYGPLVPDKNGRRKQIYLVVWIDDATRFITCARFYTDQSVNAIEDSLRRAIQQYGVPDKIFTDQGKQYRSKWLSEACAKLGIRLLSARPYHPEAKGLVERFNRTVEKFISEAALKKPASVAEYNELLHLWLDGYYHTNPHSGLGGISPKTAFGTDTRPLKFVSVEQLREAFMHKESRKVDKTGCISFNGQLYEVGLAYLGRRVDIWFDPSWQEEIEVRCPDALPFIAKKLVIGENCGVKTELPEAMKGVAPKTSRMLDALQKEHDQNPRKAEVATSFKEFWEGGEEDV